jgi:hypothetical protein
VTVPAAAPKHAPQASPTVAVSINAGTPPQVKPSFIGLSEDGNGSLSGITWSSWTADSAKGSGIISLDNGVPDMATGTTGKLPVSIVLSNPVGGIFTAMTVTDSLGNTDTFADISGSQPAGMLSVSDSLSVDVPLSGTSSSPNWAGYVATSTPGTFTSVSASWTQPTTTCSDSPTTRAASAFWVGLDGAQTGAQTLEQIGTEADCDNGMASYYAWYEMLPAGQVIYSSPVEPGDAVSASVVANSDGDAFTLTLTDSTQGWTRTTDQTSAPTQLSSAEIIAEAPTNSATNTEFLLADFSAVGFSGATINGSSLDNTAAGGESMISNGVIEAVPSSLSNGNAFYVYAIQPGS